MKFTRGPHIAFLMFLLSLTAVAQQAGTVITGRVVNEDGQPIPHAIVNILGTVKQTALQRETVTDDDGNFAVDELQAIPYLVSAWAPGYVPAADGSVLNPFELREARFVRVGQLVTVRLIRGGVITGRVMNDAGEPVVDVPVKATRVKDENGRASSVDFSYSHLWTRTTDDRGVYRIYGLAPGSYIVAAGGTDRSSSRSTPFAGRATTYHPSSTRDTATLVNVSSGDEATDIDIRYRGESGFAISGRVFGAAGMTIIFLRNPTSGETIETASIENQNAYAFYGVLNGEYEVSASSDGSASTPRRLIVKGADVTRIDLTLVANASISGVVAIEKVDADSPKCQRHRKSLPEEIIVKAKRDDASEKRGYGIGIPDDKGVFTIRDLKSGRHHIEVELPDETWYLKTMTGAKTARLNLKSGDKLLELRLTVASGAATLSGKITVAENTKLPAPLHIHLLPAETDALDDVLRFAETNADADGAFTFTNLAPGKYFVLARAMPESGDKPLRPWEPAERQKLRKEAEAANLAIELKPCQQVSSYALRLTK